MQQALSTEDELWKDKKFWRGGVVPYSIAAKKYCLGIDSKYKSLIDFGGHREPFDSNIIATAFREFREESLGVFDSYLPSYFQGLICYSEEAVLIILPLEEIDEKEISFSFSEQIRIEANPEVIDLKWLTEEEIINLSPNIIYKRTRELLIPAVKAWRS